MRRTTSHFVRLEEPDVATKKMLEVSLKAAREKYSEMEGEEPATAFKEDFKMWDEKHFNTADKKYVKELRDLLRAKVHNITAADFHPHDQSPY